MTFWVRTPIDVREFMRRTNAMSWRVMARQTGIPVTTCRRIHEHRVLSVKTLRRIIVFLETGVQQRLPGF